MADESVSEYEAKRLRRIEENRQKLRALNIPTLAPPQDASEAHVKHKKRKREPEQEDKASLKPVRKSRRQRKKRKLEKQQRKLVKFVEKQERKQQRKLEKKELRRLKKQKKLEKKLKREIQNEDQEEKHKKEEKEEDVIEEEEDIEEVEKEKEEKEEYSGLQVQPEPRIMDWRLRRKLQARAEKRLVTMKRIEELREKRMKENMKKKIKERRQKLIDRALRKKQRKKERLAGHREKKRLKLLRREERKLMRAEDLRARAMRKQEKKEAKRQKRDEWNAVMGEFVEEIMEEREDMKRDAVRERVEALNNETFPVRQLPLPLVRISDGIHADESKPLVLSPLLRVDANLFHAFSLGKQFLPPGRKTVMQALCPGGYTAAFQDDMDIHVWKNAMTLFISSTTGVFYHFLFEEAKIGGRTQVFFRWYRFQNVSAPTLWRLSQLQRGERLLRIDDDTYNIPTVSAKPEPLLLFVQYPNGPSIYCGRLGYLGHKSNPYVFAFQLLDIDALNWRQLRTLLTNC